MSLAPSVTVPRNTFNPLPIYIGLFCLLWSFAFVAGKIGVTDCPPLILLTARFSLAGILILGISALRGEGWSLSWRDSLVFALIGVANNALYLGLGYTGLKTVSAGLGGLIVSANPVFTAVLAALFLGEQLTLRKVAGLLLGIVGVGFIVWHRMSVGTDSLHGILFTFASLGSIVLGTILFKVLAPQGSLWIGNGVQNLSAGIVLLPLAAIAWQSVGGGWDAFWLAVTSNAALESFRVTLTISAGVTVVNMFFGLLIAWVLVRDDFVGKRLVDAIIDLPFALPTIVASLVMLALYGNNSPVGLHLQHTAWGVAVAVAFVTLPFVVRAVQPVLLEIDRETEEAAASLGASGPKVFTSVVLPSLTPALLSGAGLAFSRAIGEFGSVVLIGGAVPGKTEVSSQWIRTLIENDDRTGAAAISIVLLAISFFVLLVLRLVGGHAAKREALAP